MVGSIKILNMEGQVEWGGNQPHHFLYEGKFIMTAVFFFFKVLRKHVTVNEEALPANSL